MPVPSSLEVLHGCRNCVNPIGIVGLCEREDLLNYWGCRPHTVRYHNTSHQHSHTYNVCVRE